MLPVMASLLINPIWPLHLVLSMPPDDAARVVTATDRRMLPELLRICRRESVGPAEGVPCQPLGVHAIDAHHGAPAWRKAARVRWVDPACQPLEEPSEWSTRGSWGLLAAYHVRRLPPCSPPWLLDYPLLGAMVARDKLADHCRTPEAERMPANTRWGSCAWYDGSP